jgi:hypothetical protein
MYLSYIGSITERPGRNVKFESEAAIDAALQSVKENGFINYYGMIGA